MAHPCGQVIYCPQCFRCFVADEFDSKNPPDVTCRGCEQVIDELTPKAYKAAAPVPSPKPKPQAVSPGSYPDPEGLAKEYGPSLFD